MDGLGWSSGGSLQSAVFSRQAAVFSLQAAVFSRQFLVGSPQFAQSAAWAGCFASLNSRQFLGVMLRFSEQMFNIRGEDGFIVVETNIMAERQMSFIYGGQLSANFPLNNGIWLGLNVAYLAADTDRGYNFTIEALGFEETDSSVLDFKPQVFNVGLTIGASF